MQRNDVVDLQSFRNHDTRSEASDLPHLPAGTTLLLGQYTIEDYLNCGGFGITYIATDSLHRKVVIKECFPGEMCFRDGESVVPRSPRYRDELKSIIRHFVIEAHNLANIRHPNVVHVHQVFEQNDTAYIAMDFVDGPDLLDLVETGSRRLSPKQVQRITRTMLGAIEHIHSKGMLHRDISPDNILIGPDGEPVLIDFGAARQHLKQSHKANAKMKCVKDGYSPQEFYVGGSEQGAFSDLYSFAATIYHIIAGVAPADGQSRFNALAAKRADPYVPLVGTVTGYPWRFLKALDTALAVLPEDRLQNADDWLDRIRPRTANIAASISRPATAVLESLSGFETREPSVPATRLMGGNRKLYTSIAASALLAIGCIAVTGFPGPGSTTSAEPVNLAAASHTPIETTHPVVAPGRISPAPSAMPMPARLPQDISITAALPTIGEAGALEPADRLVASGRELVSTSVPADDNTLRDLASSMQNSGSEAADPPRFALSVADLSGAPGTTGARFAVSPIRAVDRSGVRSKLSVPAGKGLRPDDFLPLSQVVAPILTLEAPAFTSASRDIVPPLGTSSVPRAPLVATLPDPLAEKLYTGDTKPPNGAAPAVHGAETIPQVGYTRWDVRLPFVAQMEALDDRTVARIAFLLADADLANSGDWIAEGVTIHAVNGETLDPDTPLEEQIAASMTLGADGFTRPTVHYRVPGSDLLDIGTLALPVMRRTTLADGTILTTSAEGFVPVTRVTAVGGAGTGLRVGDIVVEEAQTGTWLASPQDIEDALGALVALNLGEAAFTVLRNGRRQTVRWTMKSE